MLSAHDLRRVATQFGVSAAQVERDHLISHILAVLAGNVADDILFFGGTALARTFLPEGRLSEDIDLIALPSRKITAQRIEKTIREQLRREFGAVTWQPLLSQVRDTEPAVVVAGTMSVRVQLLDRIGYPTWPTQRLSLEQRYADAPPAQLIVPTLNAFTAWKTVAWHDRRAPRDLYDLCLLARNGAMTVDAAELFRRNGPTNTFPQLRMFVTAPDIEQWRTQLSAQTRLKINPIQALDEVRSAWKAVTG